MPDPSGPEESLEHRSDRLRVHADAFSDRIQVLTERSSAMSPDAHPIVRETLQELSSAVEELSASEEELRAVNEELIASRDLVELERQRYWSLFQLAPDAYLVTDVDGRIVEANRAAEVLLGVPGSRMTGTELPDLACPDDRESLRACVRKVSGDDAPATATEICFHAPSGGAVTVEISAAQARVADGSVQLHWLLRDLSERRRTEAREREWAAELAARQQAEAAEARFRLIAEVSNDALWEYDWTADRLWWSDGFTRMFGPDTAGTGVHFASWAERVHPEDRERVVSAIRETAARRQRVWSDEYRLARADGTYAHVFDRGVFEYGEGGNPLRVVGSVMDVSERKAAETALHRSEERFRLLWNRSPLPKWVFDAETLRFLDVNETAVHLYGYSRDEFLRMTVRDLHPAEDLPLVDAATSTPLGSGLHTGEFRHVTRDGAVLDVAVTVQEVEHDGRRAIIAAASDITALKRTEQQLKEREALYRTLARNFPDGAVFLFDRDLRFRVAEGAGLAPAGLSQDQLEGRLIRDSFGREVWAQLETPARAALDGIPVTWEMEFNGRIYLVHAVPVRNDEGEVFAGMATAQEISAQKREQNRQRFLAEAGSLLTASMDYDERLASLARISVPRLGDYCLVDVLDGDSKFRRVEAAHADPAKQDLARALLPYPTRLDRLLRGARTSDPNRPVLFSHVSDAMLEEIAHDGRHLQIMRQLAPSSFIMVPLVGRGRTLGAMVFARSRPDAPYTRADLALAEDLARQAALCLDNARLYRQARQAVEAREEVLATVSHDLRNPIHAILLRLEALLQSTPLENRPEVEQGALVAIRESAEHMIRLVHDLIDITRIEAGQLDVRPRSEEVASTVAESLTMLQPIAAERSVRLENRVDARLPRVAAERRRVVQVISNLVANAVQASPTGGTVSVVAEAVDGEIRFGVSDSGAGIAPDDLPHIFDRFWRARQPSGRGAGLGLAIARGIVAAHGGRIWVESTPGSGSTFHFTLPQADAVADEEMGPAAEAPARQQLAAAPPLRHARAVADRQAQGSRRPDAAERTAAFLARMRRRHARAGAGSLVDLVREQLLNDLYARRMEAGDRLPSVRDVGRELGQTKHAVVQVYDELAAAGLIEKRDRSGVYVAPIQAASGAPPIETGRWLADVLTQACELRIRLPYLADLVRRWTVGAHLRCVCVEDDRDTLTSLCAETQRYFGLDSSDLSVHALPAPRPNAPPDVDAIPQPMREADIVLTTTYFAPRVRPLAEALGKPVVVVAAHPDALDAIQRHVRERTLTVICSDRRFGERIRGLLDEQDAERVRVVCSADREAIDALDRGEPVLQTFAAYEELGNLGFRLLAPHFPSLSLPCARTLSELIVRLNMEAERP